jgi:mercuric ion transport protein
MMKVQLLSFPGCPNVEATRETLRRALVGSGLAPEFDEVDVTSSGTPEALKAWGSPTVLIDGRDVGGSEPTGPCCRLYGSRGPSRGVPPQALIQKAIRRARSGGGDWLGSLAAVPGAFVALLPAATCPACLGAYFGVLSAVGLGFLLTNRLLVPVIVSFLVVGIASIAWSTRSHRRLGPLIATLAGSGALVAGRLIWRVPAMLYGGFALLVGASLWNLWLKRRRLEPLIQLRLPQKEGTTQ